MLPTVTET